MKCVLLAIWVIALVLLAARSKQRRRLKLALIGLVAALGASWIFIDSLSGRCVDYSVIYHLKAGVEGAGAGDLAFSIAWLALALLGCLLLPYLPKIEQLPTKAFAGPMFAVLFSL